MGVIAEHRKHRNRKEKSLLSFLALLALFCLLFFCEKARAAEVPESFTAESITAEGVEDSNFAEAICSGISAEIESGNYEPDSTWGTREIIENFSPANMKNGQAVISASGRGIRSIEGIRLLKNASTIDLRQNDIHDLSPLESDGSAEDKLYFNGTRIELEGNNFYNTIPGELIGSRNGNYFFDSTMAFAPAELNYICGDQEKNVRLDFGVNLHGDVGGIFNKTFSEGGTEVPEGIAYTDYADYATRYTGTNLTISGSPDASFRIVANANQNINPYMRPAIRYNTEELIEATLNLEWQYPFRTRFYRTLKETLQTEIYGGVKLLKTEEEGNPLGGAVYQLYQITGSARTRYPDAGTVYTTGGDGKLTISDLPAGSYELVESVAPEGFELDASPLSFTVGGGTEGLISGEVSGGDPEVQVTSDTAGFAPLWDAVQEDDGSGHTVRAHRMIMKEGSVSTVPASSLGADCFLSNQGKEITRLAGEVLDPSRLTLIPGQTEIRVYAGDVQIGTFIDPAKAREALNEMIRTGAFGSGTGNITITAKAAYRENESLYRELTHQNRKTEEPLPDPEEPDTEPPAVTAERGQEIIIEKTWDDEVHPTRVLFQLFLKGEDGEPRRIGKSKEANADNGFQVSWSYREIKTAAETASGSNAVPSTATASDASPSDASRATSSDASTVLYDEDGMLLDGFVLDDLGEQVYAEEIEIPAGWKPEYAAPEYPSQDTVLLKVKNRKVQIPEDAPSENRIPERTRSSGGGSGPEQKTPAPAAGFLPGAPAENREENPPAQKVLGAGRNRRVIQLPGLPYGVIAARGLPQMGEQEDCPPEYLLLFMAAVLLAAGAVFLGKRSRKEAADSE